MKLNKVDTIIKTILQKETEVKELKELSQDYIVSGKRSQYLDLLPTMPSASPKTLYPLSQKETPQQEKHIRALLCFEGLLNLSPFLSDGGPVRL